MFDDDYPEANADETPDRHSPQSLYLRALRRKAAELLQLTQALARVADLPDPRDPARLAADRDGPAANPPEDELAGSALSFMLEDALLLNGKLAGAQASTDYGRLMEAAVLVKVAACELAAHSNLLHHRPPLPAAYLDALRRDLDEFRELFAAWVGSFDRTDHYDDGWGLFVPLLPPTSSDKLRRPAPLTRPVPLSRPPAHQPTSSLTHRPPVGQSVSQSASPRSGRHP